MLYETQNKQNRFECVRKTGLQKYRNLMLTTEKNTAVATATVFRCLPEVPTNITLKPKYVLTSNFKWLSILYAHRLWIAIQCNQWEHRIIEIRNAEHSFKSSVFFEETLTVSVSSKSYKQAIILPSAKIFFTLLAQTAFEKAPFSVGQNRGNNLREVFRIGRVRNPSKLHFNVLTFIS